MKEYRNALKELFIKYGIHRALRSNTLNDLVDEINDHYIKIIDVEKQKNVDAKTNISKKFHEKHLKEQLNGWIKYLTNEQTKVAKNPLEGDGNTAYGKGVVKGFEIVIQKLKDTNEK